MITNSELENLLAALQQKVRTNGTENYSRNDVAKLLDTAFIEQWQANRAVRA